jgi:hypothetical protein
MNRANELWSVLQQANLEREAFGNIKSFVSDFNIPTERTHVGRGVYKDILQWDQASPGPQVASKLQRVMLRREKADALPDLPPKTYQTITVPIDPKSEGELAAMASRVLEHLSAEAASVGMDTEHQLALLQAADDAAQKAREGAKLSAADKEILAGTRGESPGFEELAKARKILATAKIPALLRVVEHYESQGDPILVFSAHLEPLHVLAKRPGWAIIEGKTKARDRQKIIDAFQAGKLKGVALSIRAAGVGITLTYSNKAIFLDKDWTPAGNVQAEDRIHRIGQMRQVEIISLVADHAIDQQVDVLLDRKARLIRASISAGRRGADETILPPISMVESTPGAIAPEGPFVFDAETAGYVQGPTHPEMARAEYERVRAEDRERDRIERIEQRRKPTAIQLAQSDRRMPMTEDEAWAAVAIADLSAMDMDHVALKNDMGWSAANSTAGHQFNGLLQMGLGLTESEWRSVFPMLRIHRSQVGLPPSAGHRERAEAEKAAKKGEARRKRAAKKKGGGRLKPGMWVEGPDGKGVVLGKQGKGKGLRWIIQLLGGEQAHYPRKALSVIENPDVALREAQGRLWLKISDNVLEEDSWPIAQVDITSGAVSSVVEIRPGVHSIDIPRGTSLGAVAQWLSYDSTGESPETYYQAWVPSEGVWRSALSPEELAEIAVQGASAPAPNPAWSYGRW